VTPRFTRTRSVLAVRDLRLSTRFFTEVLGFAPDMESPAGWSFLERDGFRVMLGECPDEVLAGETGNHSWFVHVVMEGLDAYHAEVVRRGAAILQPPADRPWGLREFVLRTPDGHRMVFGEVIAPRAGGR
jgi:catechol 2,3-dioxygenase-like lactoylglutathione lyase family enzyme